MCHNINQITACGNTKMNTKPNTITNTIPTGDLIELIGSFPHEYAYNTNQFEDPIIVYTDNTNRPTPGDGNQDWTNYYHVKPSYNEKPQKPDVYTHKPDVYTQKPDVYTQKPDVYTQTGVDDDYVPVNSNGYKPQRPSYPGEILMWFGSLCGDAIQTGILFGPISFCIYIT